MVNYLIAMVVDRPYPAKPPGSRRRCNDEEEDIVATRRGAFLGPREGRSYPMGAISAIYKADGDETESRYEVSEWRLDPHTQGPGAHSHPADDIFYVIEGTMTFLMDTTWKEAPRGSFVLIPGGMTHTFENRSDAPAGLLNIGVPGGFEAGMPNVMEWFANNPPGRA
jgi:quercetin dioxygenase-like cupin family protein